MRADLKSVKQMAVCDIPEQERIAVRLEVLAPFLILLEDFRLSRNERAHVEGIVSDCIDRWRAEDTALEYLKQLRAQPRSTAKRWQGGVR